MSFNDYAKNELAKPLNSANVKPPAPGKYGDYIEGWKVIEEANRIFGFDGWTRETISNVETNRDLLTLPGRNNSTYQQWRVGYVAKVRVIAGDVVREGTGFGSGMGKPEALGEAIESAVKEAETDAMKRALMTFGYPFGLALYDKTQAHVVDGPIGANETPPKTFAHFLSDVQNATTNDALQAIVNEAHKSNMLNEQGKKDIKDAARARREELAGTPAYVKPDFDKLPAETQEMVNNLSAG